MNTPYQNVLNRYKSIELQTRIDTASPTEVVELLLQGARSKIATAQGNIQRNQIKEKGEQIGRALSIIEGLKDCLDQELGGDLAANLLKLYSYIQELLLKANLKNDENLLTEANLLLAEIHEAWQSITSPKEPSTEASAKP